MAETLDNYIGTIQTAIKGESVRNAICNALEYMNEHGSNSVEKWNGHLPEEYILKTEVNRLFLGETLNLNGVNFAPFDTEPTAGSGKAVESGQLYNIFNALSQILDDINGEEVN